MKRLLIYAAVVAALAGCRREDWREMTVKVASLENADEATYAKATNSIASALRVYSGVSNGFRKEHIVWDASDKTRLTVKFDSLQVAEMNIRKTIEECGQTVDYPILVKGAPAGYIDTRRKEVEPPAEISNKKE